MTSKFLLSAGLLASVLAASGSAFAATTHKTHHGSEQRLPAQAQPAEMRNGSVVYAPAPAASYGAEDPSEDAHWGPAHHGSPDML